jgi:hypothetical protein
LDGAPTFAVTLLSAALDPPRYRGDALMKSVPFCLAGLLLTASPVVAQFPAHALPPGHAPDGACEIRPDAPYINPRLPLGRAAYAHRPACRTTWAPGPAGPGLYVQGPPLQVEAPPVSIGGLMIYLVPPEIVVSPPDVTIEPPEIIPGPAAEAPTEG